MMIHSTASQEHGRNAETLHASLQSRLHASTAWLTGHLDQFSEFGRKHPDEVSIKPIAELALCYGWMQPYRKAFGSVTEPVDACLSQWRALLCQVCEDPLYGELPRRRPAQAIYLLMPYLCMRAGGYRNPYHEDTLARLARWNYPQASETLPYRVLDRSYMLWRSGWLQREPSWKRLYAKTCLARTRQSVYLDYVSAYSITHTVFYLTDFGQRPLPLAQDEIARVEQILKALLVHYWREGNRDLTGELLISLSFLAATSSALTRACTRSFMAAFQADGSVPLLETARADSASPRPDAAEAGSHPAPPRFTGVYHTTLVGALFCAQALGRHSL